MSEIMPGFEPTDETEAKNYEGWKAEDLADNAADCAEGLRRSIYERGDKPLELNEIEALIADSKKITDMLEKAKEAIQKEPSE